MIDESKEFRGLRIAVLTLSDSRTVAEDTSGQYLVDQLTAAGHTLADRELIREDLDGIVAKLQNWTSRDDIEVIITTGGTGVTGRDNTPEALAQIADKHIEGFGEMFRMLSYQTIGTSALQSRADACVSNSTYIFALPGSNGAVKDGWTGILQYQLDIRHKPCNFAELIPRLAE